MHPVLAAAEGQAPVVQGDLVLDVEAGLLGLLVVVLQGEVGDVGQVGAVDRVVDVDRWHAEAVQPAVVGVGALVVEAEQQGVVQLTGAEVGLQVVVHGELADVLVDDAGLAVDVAVGVDGVEGGHVHRLEFQVALGVAQVLAELPDIVEAVLEGVAEGVVGAVVEIPVRLAQVLVVGDIAEGRVDLGALQGQELAGDARVVAGVLREEGQAGVVIDVPGQARRDVVALVRDMVDGRVAVARGAADAIEKLALLVDPAGAVEVDLLVFVAAGLQLNFVGLLGLRAAADHVEQAAGRGLAIDGRGRAAQHRDALEVPGLDLRVGEGAHRQRQAIEELGGHEATHLEPVGTGVGAIAAAHHAGGIAQRVVEVEGGTRIQLLAGDHRDGAWDLIDRSVGLGAGGAAGGHHAGGRAPGGFEAAVAVDIHVRQAHGLVGHRRQAEAVGAILHQAQVAALQGLGQRLQRAELAFHGGSGLAGGQGRVDAQRDAGIGGDAVQRAGQRGRRQLVAFRQGLGGQAAEGDGQRQQGTAERNGNRTHAETSPK
ncbi:hypothetical protein D9M70_422870 [compost metagenome]